MAISAVWYIILAISFLGLVGLVLWLLSIIFGDKKELIDKVLSLNFCSHLSGGRFLGTEEHMDYGKNNRLVIITEPKDVGVNNIIENETHKVVVDNNKRIEIPRGTLSKDRNIAIYLPPNPEDFPPNFRNTDIGKAMMWLTELKNYEKTVIEILREGADRRDELLKKIGDGEISKEFLQFTTGLVQDFLTGVIKPRDDKKSSSLTLGTGGTGNPGA